MKFGSKLEKEYGKETRKISSRAGKGAADYAKGAAHFYLTRATERGKE